MTNAENVQRIRSKICSTDLVVIMPRLDNKVSREARFDGLTRFSSASFSITTNVPSLELTHLPVWLSFT